MDIKSFVLSYYKNATQDFHITRITEPREALKRHNHNYFQVYYVIGGTLIHHIEAGSARLIAGDAFILPPNFPHYIQVPEGKADFYSMSFMPEFFRRMEGNRLLTDFLYFLTTDAPDRILPKFQLSYEDSVFAQTLLDRIMEEFSSQKAGKGEIIKDCVSILLSLFARVYFEEKAERLSAEQNRQLVMHCIEYIKNHFDQELTLSEMVRRSAMSKTCFCSIFNAITGTSFKDYLNRYRIEKAVDLMLEGNRTLSNVGICCGYNDSSTFYRNFKKYKGISPQAFLREHKKIHASNK